MAEPKKRIFNLLKPKSGPPNTWDNIYNWLLTQARVVMIVAEVILVIVFVGKVGVDAQSKVLDVQVAELDGQIKGVYAQTEPQVRKIQIKSQSYAKLWSKSSNVSVVLSEVLNYLGANSDRITITMTDSNLSVVGFGERSQVAVLEAALKKSQTFSKVEVIQIKSEGVELDEGTGGFGIDAIVKSVSGRELVSQ